MDEFEKIQQTVEVLTDIKCDSCGKSCKTPEPIGGFEFMELKANWGFNSEFDLQTWSAKICESCVMKKLREFINFKVERTVLK